METTELKLTTEECLHLKLLLTENNMALPPAQRKASGYKVSRKVNGGTLISIPMSCRLDISSIFDRNYNSCSFEKWWQYFNAVIMLSNFVHYQAW